MTQTSSQVRSISDTALWVACYRARETQRPDALFRDPFAERLAGPRGLAITNSLADGNKHDWAWTARTYLFDKFVTAAIDSGADLILNLAAGLCARPYRMALPDNLTWIEVDLPETISYKEKILAGDQPQIHLERIALDLSQVESRRALFAAVNARGKNVAVMSEGLLIYFSDDEVISLAQDLAAQPNFKIWLVDLASPGQLRLMQRSSGRELSQAGAPFKFGPPQGADFFAPHGWQPIEVEGLLKTAARFHRPPAELLSLLPEPKPPFGNYPWSGVCALKKSLHSLVS